MTDAPRTTRPAFTLIEASMSIVVVSIMLVSSLRVLGSARAGELTAQRRAVAIALAQGLMSEIVASGYEDPDDGDKIGPSVADISASRSLYDDAGDYDDWSASPPQEKDGTVLTDFTGYERSVTVHWVDPTDLSLTRVTATGIKRITVTVSHGGREHAKLIAYRTDAQDPGPILP